MDAEGHKSSGCFNRVNLLVVAAFLAIAAAVILHAGTNSRRSHQRKICQDQMRQLGMALMNYEHRYGQYPGYTNFMLMNNGKSHVNPRTGVKSGVAWPIMILRVVKPADLDSAWKIAMKVHLDFLVCPSDPRAGADGTALSYVVNCGMKDWAGSATMPRDWGSNGVFFDHFTGDPRVVGDKAEQIPIDTISTAYIARHDGLQTTILLSENVDAGNYTDVDETRVGILWSPVGTIDQTKNPPHLDPPNEAMRINGGKGRTRGPTDAAFFARPSSSHPNGVNIVFCDGHLKFISDKIDYYVYCLLMSTNGVRVREPGSVEVVPGFSRVLDESWIY